MKAVRRLVFGWRERRTLDQRWDEIADLPPGEVRKAVEREWRRDLYRRATPKVIFIVVYGALLVWWVTR